MSRFAWLQHHFRAARMRDFLRELPITRSTRILDVGGTPQIWSEAQTPATVFLLNQPGESAVSTRSPQFIPIYGDGCRLPFLDGAFDIVFSNSVIEHVGDASSQEAFANEIRRVGKSYWVQTPNRFFPLEVHTFLPLLHLLPASWARRSVVKARWLRIIAHPDPRARNWYIDHFDEIRLLSSADLARLFPDATLLKEQVLLLTKSLIATRRKTS